MRGIKPHLTVIEGSATSMEPPEPPDWIGETAAAEWRRVVPDLASRGRLNEADLGSVEAYCIAVGQVRDMQKIIQRDGAVLFPEGGLPKKHPAIAIQAEATNRARLLANELGLTPVSRQRPGIRGGGQSDPGDLFGGLDF